MRLIILGPPGTGKGTQSRMISEKFGVPHVSSGDILRENVSRKTDIGKKAEIFMKKGQLVPDNIVVKMMAEILGRGKYKNFILDGFPRTINQAHELEHLTEIDLVMNLESSEKVIMERLSGRRVCSACKAVYHIRNMPPKEEGVCDKCGGRLVIRDDDKPETIRDRLKIYQVLSDPLIFFYSQKGLLREIDGDQPIEKIFGDIVKAIKKGDLA
ncbi:adenylate kinase [Candidatus Woesearchaeota archaeon]|nr:adenylate kinase [Candidatus Woesearchaeota archaeon]